VQIGKRKEESEKERKMSNYSRRDFLALSTTGVACASLGMLQGCKTLFASKAKPKIGVQLYSIREVCKSDLVGSLKALKEIGYAGVEFAGTYGKSAKELKGLLDDHGLLACGTHAGLDTLKPDKLSATLDFYSQLGCPYITVPYLRAKDAAGWIDFAKQCTVAQEVSRKSGIRIGYHNHQHEFREKIDGVSQFQIFFDNASPEVNMQLDVGHVVAAGEDPLVWMKKYPGRSYTPHAKEVYPGPGILGQPGEGKKGVDWDAFFVACEADVTEWYVVETEADPKSIENVRQCFEFLKAKGRA
jgi:sugar phosphate isomerase/epimerase